MSINCVVLLQTFALFYILKILQHTGCKPMLFYPIAMFSSINRNTLLRHHNYQINYIRIMDYLKSSINSNKSILNGYSDYFWQYSTMPSIFMLNVSKEYEEGMIWFLYVHYDAFLLISFNQTLMEKLIEQHRNYHFR